MEFHPTAHNQNDYAGKVSNQPSIDFHGAAFIDTKGKEIPITEEMIQQACQQVQQSCPH